MGILEFLGFWGLGGIFILGNSRILSCILIRNLVCGNFRIPRFFGVRGYFLS